MAPIFALWAIAAQGAMRLGTTILQLTARTTAPLMGTSAGQQTLTANMTTDVSGADDYSWNGERVLQK
jgi:hypothetical protein